MTELAKCHHGKAPAPYTDTAGVHYGCDRCVCYCRDTKGYETWEEAAAAWNAEHAPKPATPMHDTDEGPCACGAWHTKIGDTVVTTANPPQPGNAIYLDATAGVKHDAGKLRFDLLPVEPLRELARVYTIGATKYADNNWRKGLAWGRVFAAMMRHAWSWWGGERNDPVDGQHHLASVAWCALTLIEYERTHPELDDRVVKP